MAKTKTMRRVELFFSSGRHSTFTFDPKITKLTVTPKQITIANKDRSMTTDRVKLDYYAELTYQQEIKKPENVVVPAEDEEPRDVQFVDD